MSCGVWRLGEDEISQIRPFWRYFKGTQDSVWILNVCLRVLMFSYKLCWSKEWPQHFLSIFTSFLTWISCSYVINPDLLGWQSGKAHTHTKKTDHDWWCVNLWWLSAEAWTPDCWVFFIVTLFMYSYLLSKHLEMCPLFVWNVWLDCAQNIRHCRDGGFTAEQFQERECPQLQYPIAPPSRLSCQFVSPLVHSRQG